MLKTETMSDGRIRTWSDAGMQILQNETGVLYHDAVDVPNRYTYTETDEPIPVYSEEATSEDYEAALARLGVKT